MNYNEFYKRAGDENSNGAIDGVYDYKHNLPMLALLAGTGALGGYALANKKKRGAGALFGGATLPALYLAYLYGRRGGWFGPTNPSGPGNSFDNAVNSYINDPVNKSIGGWFESDDEAKTKA